MKIIHGYGSFYNKKNTLKSNNFLLLYIVADSIIIMTFMATRVALTIRLILYPELFGS